MLHRFMIKSVICSSTLTPKNFGGTNFGHFFDIPAEKISDTFSKLEIFFQQVKMAQIW